MDNEQASPPSDDYEFNRQEIEEIENDPVVCEICLDGEVYEDNEILFCDKCDIPVHQSCYGVDKVPDGPWYCYVCSDNLDPNHTSCELCPHKGGAFKYTNKLGKWVHGLCACWIPEVFEVYPPDSSVYVNLSNLDVKRYKLKCVICSKKGACVQCAYGRCTTAVHPWCALKDSDAGFARRIIKNEEGNMLWEIFCKTHAKAVSDPVKMKIKSKGANTKFESHIEHTSDDSKDVYWQDTVGKTLYNNVRSPLSVVKNEMLIAPTNFKQREEDGYDFGKHKLTMENSSKIFPIVSLLEWPGINEGDAMDLDHFWNYVSSFFVEDHSSKWLDSMIHPFKDAEISKYLKSTTPVNCEVEECMDLLMSNFSHENKSNMLIMQKRNLMLKEVDDIIRVLDRQDSSLLDLDDYFVCNNVLSNAQLYVDELNFLSGGLDSASLKPISDCENLDKFNLEVVFNGQQRVCGTYSLSMSPAENLDSVQTMLENNISDGLYNNFIFPFGSQHSLDSLIYSHDLNLTIAEVLCESSNICLNNGKIFISKLNDNELSRIVFTDERAVSALESLISSKVENLVVQNNIRKLCENNLDFAEESKIVCLNYSKQQIWRKICASLCRGFIDNIVLSGCEEDLPPSWKIATEGRPNAEIESDTEPHEDAVCMCCFDGVSSENNRIIFCDGCNCAVHQLCYGVADIPDGDYYCDRCKAIQLLFHETTYDFDEYTIKHSVRCCLCPLHHGGLKSTNDGRWVHMFCFFMAGCGVLDDLREMSVIDISKVRSFSERVFCQFCGDNSGYLMKCGFVSCEEQCNVAFHPICAWFAGLLTDIEIVDPSFGGLNKLTKYPNGINFSFFCEKHSTLKRGNGKSLQQRQEIRSRYRINERDLEIFPGENKRKRNKSKRKYSLVPSRQATSLKSTQKELPVDIYNSNICCLCFNPVITKDVRDQICFGDLANSQSIIDDVDDDLVEFAKSCLLEPDSKAMSVMQCSKCKIVAHTCCLSSLHSRYQFLSCGSLCSVCAESDQNCVTCSLCPRKGGMFVQSFDSTWVHMFCAQHVPALIKWLPNGELDYKLITKECKKQKCSICNRKMGVCVQCCEIGCVHYFHPLCVAKSGLGVIRSRGSSREVFCKDHIPIRLECSNSGSWVDGYELQMLRHCFDRARLVLDLLIKREKLKKSLFKANADLFDSKFHKLLSRSKGGTLEVRDEEPSDIDSVISVEDDIANQFVSLESLCSKLPQNKAMLVKLTDQSEVEISGLWCDSQQIRIPKMSVSFCCVEISKNDTIREGGRRGFCSFQRNIVENNLYKSRKTAWIFPSHAQELNFQKSLSPYFNSIVNINNEEFVRFCEDNKCLASSLSVKELDEADSKKKRKKCGSNEADPASKLQKIDHNGELEELLHYAEVHKISSILQANSSIIQQNGDVVLSFKQHFLHISNHINASLECWKVYSSFEIYALERLLQDLLNFVEKQHVDSEQCFSKASNDDDSETLVKDFETIPYESIPNYNGLVRKAVCLKDIRKRLHDHEYTCVAAFTHDFFQMLNNARNITDCESKVWKDSQVLGELCDELLCRLQDFPLCIQPRSKNSRLELSKITKSSTTQNGKKLFCSNCNLKFVGVNWPKSFTADIEEDRSKGGGIKTKKITEKLEQWYWLCPDCIKSLGESLIDERVQVWWDDDLTAYFGVINAFDKNSQCHRILYDDLEWEFINLGAEPLYIKRSENFSNH